MSVSHAGVLVSSLLAMLASVPDPRDRRGVRHPLASVLAIAVVAKLAGAANYRELGSVAADFSQELLALLGARFCAAKGGLVAPCAGTLRRVLIAIDAETLDARTGAWLHEAAACDSEGWAIALDGKDLNGAWDGDGRLVLFSAMTHRGEAAPAVTIGQVEVPADTKEVTQVPPLVGPLNLAGALVTIDAAHTTAATARYLVDDAGADYLMTIKPQRFALHRAALRAGRALCTTTEPGHTIEERGHGRISRWTTWVSDLPPESEIPARLPHATRLAVIRRDIADLDGQPRSKEFALVVTSRNLNAAGISRHTRGHWGIENLSHRARDTVWHEDHSHAYHGNGPRAMATLRNLALGLLALHGITKIKQTIQQIGRNPIRAIPLIT